MKRTKTYKRMYGPVSTRDNRVLYGPLGRSLRLFPRSAALRSASLALLARSVHGLAHSLRSLPRRTVEIPESVFMLRSRSKETNAILVVTGNTPYVINEIKQNERNESNHSLVALYNWSRIIPKFFWNDMGFSHVRADYLPGHRYETTTLTSLYRMGVFVLTTRILIVPINRDFSMNTDS